MYRYIKIISDMEKKYHYLYVFCITIFIFILISDYIPIHKYGDKTIQITALAEKNELAHGNEVWISSLKNGGKKINLSEIEVTNKNWLEKDGCLFAKPVGKDEILVISLKNAENIDISFQQHAWCGKVQIKCADFYDEIDLYSDTVGTINVEIASEPKANLSLIDVFVLIFAFLGIYGSVWVIFICTREKIPSKIMRICIYECGFFYFVHFVLCEYFKAGTIVVSALFVFLSNYSNFAHKF